MSIEGGSSGLGSQTSANSTPVVIASDQGAVSVTGPLTDTQLRATPVPVSGTVTAANASVSTTGSAVPGSATMVGGTDGTNLRAIKVSSAGVISTDSSATTQPISAASLPLPTGAATAAKQPALGTAGTASADVITVQGIASMTALKIDGSAVTQPISGTVTANAGTNLNTSALALESGGNLATIKTNTDNLALAQASTTSGQKGNLILGAVTTAAPSYTTAQSNPLSLSTVGNLRVDGSSVTQPVSGTVAATQSGTWTVQPGNTANTTAWKVDGSAVTQPVSGTVTATTPSGSFTDRSGTATTSTSQITAANSSRKYFYIQNSSGGTIWIDFGVSAVASTPSIRLLNGEDFKMDGSFINTQAINVISSSGSRAYAAKEG